MILLDQLTFPPFMELAKIFLVFTHPIFWCGIMIIWSVPSYKWHT